MKTSLLFGVLILLTTISNLENASANESDILRRLDLIEERLKKLEEVSDSKSILREALKNAIDAPKTDTDDQGSDKSDLVNTPPMFEARLVSIKKTGEKSALDMPLYEIALEVTNASDQSTSIINAYIDIKDKADNLIARIKWDGNKGIAARKSRILKGRYADNRFEEARLERLYEIDKELVTTHFNVYKIVFSDGNVVEYQKCVMCEF